MFVFSPPLCANEVCVCWRERLLYYDLYLDLTICGSQLWERQTPATQTGSGTGYTGGLLAGPQGQLALPRNVSEIKTRSPPLH